MNAIYETKLKQKCFFPWRALTYKEGFESSVRRQTQTQLRKVHTGIFVLSRIRRNRGSAEAEDPGDRRVDKDKKGCEGIVCLRNEQESVESHLKFVTISDVLEPDSGKGPRERRQDAELYE